jgi:DNA primase catalytic core
MGGSDEIAQIIRRVDLGQVAKNLGIQVETGHRQPLRAICPFHNDSDPSLNLYKGGNAAGDRAHYHCFVCGAHGDAVSLIQNYKQVSFWEAVQWLANSQGIELSTIRKDSVDRRSGAAMLADRIKSESVGDPIFAVFANSRGFGPLFLRRAGAALIDLRPLADLARIDRTAEEKLVEAGIFRRNDKQDDGPDLYGTSLKGFFVGKRIVFQMSDLQMGIAGFAARSLNAEQPKYLFSYNFPRRNILYAGDRILAALRTERQDRIADPVEIYLVEGIFDVLRLETLGYKAAGILGSRITPGQLESLKSVIEAVHEAGRILTIHIFLDRDDAGRRGAYDAAISLLTLLDQSTPFEVDVVWPADGTEGKIDPDSWLRDRGKDEAARTLSAAKVPVLVFLGAFRLGADPHSVDWNKPGRLKLAAEARHVALALPQSSWSRILAPQNVGYPGDGLAEFVALVRSYGGDVLSSNATRVALEKYRDPADDRADLLSALTLGRSSTSRREYPLDDDAWERLAVAASPLFHLHRARLAIGDGPSAPLLSRELPKGEGRYRLKSGPVSQDALLQQYILLELLRDRVECQPFAGLIPAVRFARERSAAGGIYRTGATGERNSLSFAYQIDMAIVNGDAPPKREGIFRPYFECWRSFIDFLDDRIKRFQHEDLQILRLDITGFYDHVRRDVVSNALAVPLERALNLLRVADGDDPTFAPLLRPDVNHDTAKRSETITDFILNHSFGLSYLDPKSGEEKVHDRRRGIPQGPDLSAYLANISLFDLDDMMDAEINRLNEVEGMTVDGQTSPKCAAGYARYVDDVVLICRDLETAYQLRRKIESWLGLKGLSLNRKNVTPPPMTRAEARAWLTDNRAGFGFSGPLADLPTTEAMDPLADAGEIDRKTALGLLFDPELDDPSNDETSLIRIGLALSAPDIRFNDRASAYRRLWCLAASQAPDATGQAVSASFWGLLTRAEPQFTQLFDKEKRLDIGLACFEGLDRALRSTIPAGMLADDICDQIAATLLKLSRGTLDDVFTPFATQLLGETFVSTLLSRYDVRCQIGITACVAAQKVAIQNETVTFSRLRAHIDGSTTGSGRASLPEGLRLSLVKFDPVAAVAGTSLVVSRHSATDVAFTAINRTIVALQRVAQFGETEEPTAYKRPVGDEPNSILNLTNQILTVWTPSAGGDVGSDIANEVELDAAATLVNITYRSFAGVASRRPRLMHLIAKTSHAKPLPSPPGLKTSGIMLWCNNGKLLFASADSAVREPIGTSWTDAPEQPVSGIKLRVADLPADFLPLYLADIAWTPTKIAAVYRAAFPTFAASLAAADGVIPVPTAFSFFVHSTNGVPDLNAVSLVSWGAARESVDGHAFIRNGSALEAKKIYAEGADYWRYGWAIRDVCERADLLTDDEAGLDAHAATALHRDIHRREAIVARVLPRLSGADRWGPGATTPEKPIPTRIERALSLLEHFEASNSPAVDAAYLVAAVAEGIYMSEQINTDVDLSAPGQPAALMIRSTRRLTRSLPEAAKHWPTSGEFTRPYRRSAAAWQALGDKVVDYIPIVADSAVAPLSNLALGIYILASVADLRSLAFELSSAISRDAIEQLEQSELETSWLSDIVGLDLILVDEDSPAIDPSLEAQAQKLIKSFCQIVLGRKGGLSVLRDKIAPAGWVILVAVMLQVAPLKKGANSLRPALWRMDAEKIALAEAALRTLVSFLASSFELGGTDDGWPWDAFRQLSESKPRNLVDLLRQITDCASLSVTDEISWSNPRTGDLELDRPVMRLADGGSVSLADWQIDIAHIRGERGTATEASSVGSRLQFQYSVARLGDQVLGMHLVSRQLAEAAFQSTEIGEAGGPEQPDAFFNIRMPTAKHPDAIGTTLPVELDPEPIDKDIRQPDTPSLDTLKIIQRQSWRSRAKEKSVAVRRLAIVQWDVVETYYQPGEKGGLYEGLLKAAGNEAARAGDLKNGGVFLSTTEFRRRAILKEVLASCVEFQVDGIVLPEYSVRPETVNWLARQIRAMGRPLTIWCGTFRVPSATQIDLNFLPSAQVPFATAVLSTPPTGRNRWDFHTALLTCLRASQRKDGKGIEVSHFVRQKRFPSAAVGELIRPPLDQDWRPLLHDDTDPFELGTFTLELICSEMFPHASSANFIGVIQENQELAQRYGLGKGSESPFRYLSRDIYEFARWTAYRNSVQVAGDAESTLVRGKALQRTLIILPAMTARSADYHIFGQNQYLAAGLVTAFCNAVAPPYGCGQSGFIGLDGWKVTEGIRTPYGSKAPGIFQLGGRRHSGPLGKTESAIVIADLDLLRTADQKPTLHYQSRALQLVAHLPMIFATEPGKGDLAGSYPNRQRRPRFRTIGGKSKTFEEFSSVIIDALGLESIWRAAGNIADADQMDSPAYAVAVQATLDGLEILERFADDSGWLEKRTESFTDERYTFPPVSPLPALVDWIYVDDRWLPEPSTINKPDGHEDALTSDRPVLAVPRSMKDEVPREPS